MDHSEARIRIFSSSKYWIVWSDPLSMLERGPLNQLINHSRSTHLGYNIYTTTPYHRTRYKPRSRQGKCCACRNNQDRVYRFPQGLAPGTIDLMGLNKNASPERFRRWYFPPLGGPGWSKITGGSWAPWSLYWGPPRPLTSANYQLPPLQNQYLNSCVYKWPIVNAAKNILTTPDHL